MPREQLIRSEPHEDYYSENDESGPNYHRVSKRAAADSLSHASLYSIIDLDHETLIERATQLAAMLDKSARDLTQYTKLARVQDGLTITKKKYVDYAQAFVFRLFLFKQIMRRFSILYGYSIPISDVFQLCLILLAMAE